MIQREFLGWDKPLLPCTVDYLLKRYTKDRRLDLSQVVLALPGRRAINRLEELLAARVEQLADENQLEPDWYPPEFLTLGTLPERFYWLKKPIADDLSQRFAWLYVLDRMNAEAPDLLRTLLPHPPASTDLEARLTLGRLFASLHKELGADALDFEKVAELCGKMGLASEQSRWNTLARLQAQYLALLDSYEIWDLQTARLYAIQHQASEEYHALREELDRDSKHFFLVGLVDMNKAQKDILNKFSEYITALIFAPESMADRFDAHGCLVPAQWAEFEPPIGSGSRIHVVEKPEQQAEVVMRKIAALNERYCGSEIIVGVPDPRVVPPLRQKMDQADISSRYFEGTPMKQTPIYRFFELMVQLLDFRSFRAFADFIRHPDVEERLDIDTPSNEQAENEKTTGKKQPPVDRLLTASDKYQTEFLPIELTGNWKELNDPDNPWRNHSFETLRKAWTNMLELLELDPANPDTFNRKKPIRHWTELCNRILERLYDEHSDSEIVEGRKLVQAACEKMLDIPNVLLPGLTLPETLKILLLLLQSGNIPPHELPHSIELIGWLEIAMDDSPIVFVTGMNEGFVPSSLTSDMFLPDKVRSFLGIEDNARRYARDCYALTVILATRQAEEEQLRKNGCSDSHTVELIASRRSNDGEPLLPSRLFFATDSQTVAERVKQYFSEPEKQAPLLFSGSSVAGQEKTAAFTVPEVQPVEKIMGAPVRSMSVTEFKEYIKCPYRYYLKYRLRLNELHDRNEELDAASFGNLVHAVLQDFGRELGPEKPIRHHELCLYLESALKRHLELKYGQTPRPAILIQQERAHARLMAFADWQIDWWAQGRKVVATEMVFDPNHPENDHDRFALHVDGIPMPLKGRIDRIDLDEATGILYVLDYKTSDSGADPDKTHRKKLSGGEYQWIDLQLPLYQYLVKESDLYRENGYDEHIELGYITLPKSLKETGFKPAGWGDETISAIEEAKNIVRRVRNNDFPMTSPPPPYSEMFEYICMDGIMK